MDIFTDQEHLASLQAELVKARGERRLELQVQLAWFVRQSDMALSQQLREQVLEQLDSDNNVPRAQGPNWRARMQLLHAEHAMLRGQLDEAHQLAHSTLHTMHELEDHIGCADCHWLLTWIGRFTGQTREEDTSVLEMIKICTREQDVVRTMIAQARHVVSKMFSSPDLDLTQWEQLFSNPSVPVIRAWVAYFHATRDYVRGQDANSISHYIHAWQYLQSTGQALLACIVATNISERFTNLNHHQTALEWQERALALACKGHWPSAIANCKIYSAMTLLQMRRLDDAEQMLNQAFQELEPIGETSLHVLAMQCKADLEQYRNQHVAALKSFARQEVLALKYRRADLHVSAQIGQARSLLALGEVELALHQARAIAVPPESDLNITVLCLLAQIHADESQTPDEPLQAPSAELHYLLRALEVAQQRQNHVIDPELFNALAHACAKRKLFEQAWEYSRQALQARKQTHPVQDERVVRAMQSHYENESTQTARQHQRALAADIRRTSALLEMSDLLRHLNVISQDITSHLQHEEIYWTVHKHARQLFEHDAFSIALVRGDELVWKFMTRDGKTKLPGEPTCKLDDDKSFCAQAWREHQDILIDVDSVPQENLTWIEGGIQTQCGLFSPMLRGNQVFGVISLQSAKAATFPYGIREMLIMGTLGSSAAIALSNADTHTHLQEALQRLQTSQQQMLLQEKMAGLGTLTAGLANEINNPTSFAYLATQNLGLDIDAFSDYVRALVDQENAGEVWQSFEQRFSVLRENQQIMLNGCERITQIVKDLHIFARQDPLQMEMARLLPHLQATLNLVRTSWQSKVEFKLQVTDDPPVLCWPAQLSQVFMNLLVNACQAIEEKWEKSKAAGEAKKNAASYGCIQMRLWQEGKQLHFEVQDDGCGIPDEHKARVLEPFFTTKQVGTGTGLGLALAYGIALKHGGKLDFTSSFGHGSCFLLSLPIPDAAEGGHVEQQIEQQIEKQGQGHGLSHQQ